MAKSYHPIGTDCAVVVEREDTDWYADVRLKAGRPDDDAHAIFPSRVLRTEEIGELSAYLALIYSQRTGKMPMFPTKLPVAVDTFEVGEKPRERFFYHPESHCLMRTSDGTDMTDQEVVEIDEARFKELQAEMKKAEDAEDFSFDLEEDEV